MRIFMLMLLVVSWALPCAAGEEPAPHAMSAAERQFVADHGDGLYQLEPGVYRTVDKDGMARVYAFGLNGLNYTAKRFARTVDELTVAGNDKAKELHHTLRRLDDVRKQWVGVGTRDHENESGIVCYVFPYEIDATAWPANNWYTEGTAEAYVGGALFGPVPVVEFDLYAFTRTDWRIAGVPQYTDVDSDSTTGYPWPAPVTAGPVYSTVSAYSGCRRSESMAWVFGFGDQCNEFFSVSTDFIMGSPADC